MESRAKMAKSRGSEMALNLLHREICHPGIHLTGVLLEGDKVLGNKEKNLTWCATFMRNFPILSIEREQQLDYCPKKRFRWSGDVWQ
jgi:hypothetical protein